LLISGLKGAGESKKPVCKKCTITITKSISPRKGAIINATCTVSVLNTSINETSFKEISKPLFNDVFIYVSREVNIKPPKERYKNTTHRGIIPVSSLLLGISPFSRAF
jgi:hypothetical protein